MKPTAPSPRSTATTASLTELRRGRTRRVFRRPTAAAAVVLACLTLAAPAAEAQWEYRGATSAPEMRIETREFAVLGDSIPDSLTDTRIDTQPAAPADGGGALGHGHAHDLLGTAREPEPEPEPGLMSDDPIEAELDENSGNGEWNGDYATGSENPAGLDPDRFQPANYYFPTRFELDQARAQTDRPRSRPRDAEQLAFYGQWDEGTGPDQDGFYYRNRRAFSPINRTLQFLSPETITLFEAREMGRGGFSFNPNLPFTRAFDPNAAHVKAGPLFFDLLSIQAGAVWSDFNGDRSFLEGQEPGWLFFVGLTGRTVVRLTDQFYLTAFADLYYLPRSNQVGVGFNSRLGLGTQTFARLNYIFYPGMWEVLAYAETGVRYNFGNLLAPLREDSIEQRGRYEFGRVDLPNRRATDFSSDNIFPYVETGVFANRPFGTDWRLFTGLFHREVWRSFDFKDRSTVDWAFARTVYQSAIWPIHPYAEYRIYSSDRLQNFRHTARIGATARLSQYLTADAGVGYFWTSGPNTRDSSSFIWDVGLQHDLTERTHQTLRVGQDYRLNDLNNEFYGTQATYTINHQFTNFLGARGFANYFYGDDLTERESDIESWRIGLGSTASLYWGTDLTLLGFYDETKRKGPGVRTDRLILRGTLRNEILPRLVGEIGYQYEDYNSTRSSGFDEHLLFMNLTRYF